MLSYIPGNVKLWESPGRAGGLPSLLGTNFGPKGSGSGPPEWALLNVFEYSNAIGGYNSGNNIPEANLYNMVNPNLHAGFPVGFGIVCPAGAHSIVCDGYGYNYGTIYHHVNMGWIGSGDGWYNLPTVDGYTAVINCDYNFYTSGSGEIIAGRVTDWKRNPLSGAGVQLTTTGKSPVAFATLTDTQGGFAFAKIASASTYNITVTAKGHTFPQFSATTGTSINGGIDVGNMWMQDLAEPIPPRQTLLSVTSSEDPSNYGDPVTFTATVAGSGSTPTGTVQFYYTIYSLAQKHQQQLKLGKPVKLSGGSAAISTSTLPPGSIPIMAAYSGDKNYNNNTAYLPDGQTVNKDSSTTTVSSSQNPATYGKPVTFTATVTGAGGTPTGTVQFVVDGINFDSVNLTNGSATSKATSSLGCGANTITASYGGDPYFQSSTGTFTQLIWQGSVATTTTVSSNPDPSYYGQSVTFTATVTGQGGTPSGTVTFQADNGATTLGSATLVNGSATVSTSTLSMGQHTITAYYNGDNTFFPSSGTLPGGQTVNKVPTTTTVVSSKNPSNYGQSVVFAADVENTDGHGTVQFAVDGSNYGAPVSLGLCKSKSPLSAEYYCAIEKISNLQRGTHSISANFSGDNLCTASSGTLGGGQVVK